jgi:hypothetical protein
MAKYKVKVQPSGLINTAPWPAAGETVDLPESIGDAMVDAGTLESLSKAKKTAKAQKVEKRPATRKGEEKR